MRIALIGATGLVGAALGDRLLAAGHDVHALTRRPTGRHHPRWHEHGGEMESWPDMVETLSPDAAVSALGTTWRKAGSEDAFRAVDQHGVIAFAAAAHRAGARRMASVSAAGASADSSNFYLRTKGRADRALEAIGFDRLDLFRPGLLVGSRANDRRLAERIGIALSPVTNLFLRGPLAPYAAIPTAIVADAILASLSAEGGGLHVHENPAIRRLAGD